MAHKTCTSKRKSKKSGQTKKILKETRSKISGQTLKKSSSKKKKKQKLKKQVTCAIALLCWDHLQNIVGIFFNVGGIGNIQQ